jgi:hypothetical protein
MGYVANSATHASRPAPAGTRYVDPPPRAPRVRVRARASGGLAIDREAPDRRWRIEQSRSDRIEAPWAPGWSRHRLALRGPRLLLQVLA